MTQHTPGPWKYVEDNCGSRVEADGMGFSAPYRLEPGSGRCAQQVADNKLIASAPDLLALLHRVAETKGLIGNVTPIMVGISLPLDTWNAIRSICGISLTPEPEYECESCKDTGVRNERKSCPYCDKG